MTEPAAKVTHPQQPHVPEPRSRSMSGLLMAALGAVLFGAGVTASAFDRYVAASEDVIDRADALEAVLAHRELAPWTRIPGTGSAAAALQVNLSQIAQSVDLATDLPGETSRPLPPVERDLVRLLQAAPTDVGAWLRLAAARWDRGDGGSAEQAWEMAAILAPREGALVTARLQLAFSRWQELGSTGRRMAARDAALALSEPLALANVQAKAADLSLETRQLIAEALIASQGLGQGDLQRLGLLR